VRFAEDAGFTIAMTSDHVALTPDVAETYPAPFYDPFVTFAWLAAETRAIRLGTTVNVVPLRHPLLTARLAANVDRPAPWWATTPPEQLYPDTTFTDKWSADVGDEKVSAKFYGRAHTSGDVVVTFERANVAHMGDLMFNQRHPVVDRAAGALLRSWAQILDRVPKDHDKDTIYIFGHSNTGLPVVGSDKELATFRNYIGALLAFVEAQVKAGKSRDEILAMRDPLKGFESFGRFGQANARDPLTCAYEEVTTGT